MGNVDGFRCGHFSCPELTEVAWGGFVFIIVINGHFMLAALECRVSGNRIAEPQRAASAYTLGRASP